MTGPGINACRGCGWDVRPGAKYCRACDDAKAARAAARKAANAKRAGIVQRFPPLVDLDDEVPF